MSASVPSSPRRNLPVTLLLTLATVAASALAMLFSTEIGAFLVEWRQATFLPTFLGSLAMLAGAFLVWRRWWAGGLLFVLGAVLILLLVNTTPSEQDRRTYDQVILLLSGLAGVGLGALLLAALLEAGLWTRRGLPLASWLPELRPGWLLIAYVALSLFLLYFTSTGRGRPFYELLDRPMHGQDILPLDALLALVVLVNQVILIALLLGQRWAIKAMVVFILLDMVLTTLLVGFAPIFIVLRMVALGLLLFVVQRSGAYFDAVRA